MKKHRKSLGLLIILIGIIVFMKPYALITVSKFGEKQAFKNYVKNERKLNSAEIKKYNKSLRKDAGSVVDPFAVEGYKTPSPIKELKEGEAFGYVAIPSIGEVLPLYLGASQEHLAEGLGQIEGTSLPVGGVDSRCVIAGHRGFYKKPMLRYVDRVKNGDKLYIYADGRRMVYKAYSREEIYPSENDRLRPLEGQDTVTLLSCTPYPTNRKRILVNFRRDEEAEKEFRRISSDNVDKIIETDIKSEKTDSKAKTKNMLIYIIAIISAVAAVFVSVKLVKTFISEMREDKENIK